MGTATTIERLLGQVVGVLGLAVAVGCRHDPPPVVAPPAAPARSALHRGPLTDYVPAAGLRWMLVVRLREVMTTPGVRPRVLQLIATERFDAFAHNTGLDLRTTETGLVAGFDFGTLYLARTQDTAAVETAFVRRLTAPPLERRPHPELHLLTGVVGGGPRTLVTVQDTFAGFAIGDPTPARVVGGYALAKLRSKPALAGAALASLPRRLTEAPLRGYAPGPFEGDWARAGLGLLEAATAVAGTAEFTSDGGVRLRVVIAGRWDLPGSDASTRLEAAYLQLAASALGRLLALDQPRAAPLVTTSPDHLTLTVDLALDPLLAGLHAAVAAETDELMR